MILTDANLDHWVMFYDEGWRFGKVKELKNARARLEHPKGTKEWVDFKNIEGLGNDFDPVSGKKITKTLLAESQKDTNLLVVDRQQNQRLRPVGRRPKEKVGDTRRTVSENGKVAEEVDAPSVRRTRVRKVNTSISRNPETELAGHDAQRSVNKCQQPENPV